MANSRLPVFTERFTLLRGEMTQAKFAEKLDLSRPTVSLYESGDRIPDAETLKTIAEKCNVSADYLIGLRNDPTTDEDVQFISDYTGLSSDAIELLNYYAYLHNDPSTARYLENFGQFITGFYGQFLETLGHLREYVADAKEDLQDGPEDTLDRIEALELDLEGLQRELFIFSQLCNKIPRKLFDSEKILEDLEREIKRLEKEINSKNIKTEDNSENHLPF